MWDRMQCCHYSHSSTYDGCYRKLRVTRVTLHRNLILSIIVRNSFSIAVKVVIILDAISDKSVSIYTSFTLKLNQHREGKYLH